MDLASVLRERRAVRKFADRPVERRLVEEIIQEAAWAPSGGNLQPWRVAVLGPEAVRRYLATCEGDAVDLLATMMKLAVVHASERQGQPPPAGLNALVTDRLAPRVSMSDAPPSHLLVVYHQRQSVGRFLATLRTSASLALHNLLRRQGAGRKLRYLWVMLSRFVRLVRMDGQAKVMGLSNYVYALTLAAFDRGIDSCIQCHFAADQGPLRRAAGLDRRAEVVACVSLGYRAAQDAQGEVVPTTRDAVPTVWVE